MKTTAEDFLIQQFSNKLWGMVASGRSSPEEFDEELRKLIRRSAEAEQMHGDVRGKVLLRREYAKAALTGFTSNNFDRDKTAAYFVDMSFAIADKMLAAESL